MNCLIDFQDSGNNLNSIQNSSDTSSFRDSFSKFRNENPNLYRVICRVVSVALIAIGIIGISSPFLFPVAVPVYIAAVGGAISAGIGGSVVLNDMLKNDSECSKVARFALLVFGIVAMHSPFLFPALGVASFVIAAGGIVATAIGVASPIIERNRSFSQD